MKSSFGALGPTGCLAGILAMRERKESIKQPERYVQDVTKREHSERVSQTRQSQVAPGTPYISQARLRGSAEGGEQT